MSTSSPLHMRVADYLAERRRLGYALATPQPFDVYQIGEV